MRSFNNKDTEAEIQACLFLLPAYFNNTFTLHDQIYLGIGVGKPVTGLMHVFTYAA